MKQQLQRRIRIASCVLAGGFAAFQLNAQGASFTLPVAAHLGTAVLSSGAHTLEIAAPSGPTVVTTRGNDSAQMTVPMVIEGTASKGRSYLHLTKVRGEYYIDQFHSAGRAKTFFFHSPKVERGGSREEERQEAMVIPVAGQ